MVNVPNFCLILNLGLKSSCSSTCICFLGSQWHTPGQLQYNYWGQDFFPFLKKIYLLIMLLQLSHFPPFTPLHPAHPLPPTFPLYSSCPWVIHISSLASTFPILILTSHTCFVPTSYATYSLYLFTHSPPPLPC